MNMYMYMHSSVREHLYVIHMYALNKYNYNQELLLHCFDSAA
jgi:hypothetical protein